MTAAPAAAGPPPPCAAVDPDADPAVQAAIEASLLDAGRSAPAAGAAQVNAQISGALLGTRAEEPQRRVVLLKFGRRPEVFRTALLTSEALGPVRRALEAQGLAVVLPTKAKVFVHPQHYEPVMEAIRQQGLTLYGDHVIVEPELVPTVKGVLRRITKPKREAVIAFGS